MSESAFDLLSEIKSLAARYYATTGRPLGVTSEVGELEAAAKLDLTLASVRTPLFDATSHKTGQRIQIKTRAVTAKDKYRGRVPSIQCDGDFHTVVLVLIDKLSYEPLEIWEASRVAVKERLDKPGSKSRNVRRSMGVSQFKSIATLVWRNA